MGNGNTRPPTEPTELEAEGEEFVGSSKGKSTPAGLRKIIGHRRVPTEHATTTAVTVLGRGTSASYTGKYHCVAPSSNPLPPAAPSSSATLPQSTNSSDPALALPTRVVFSASLERSLVSAGRRRPTVLHSSSSWTSGRLTRDDSQSSDTASASSSFASSSLRRRQQLQEDGEEASHKTADKAAKPKASTRTTTRYMQHNKRQGKFAASKTSEIGREGEDSREAASTSGLKSRRWIGLRGNRPLSSSGEGSGGGGDATTLIETIIHTARSKSPDEITRCRGDQHASGPKDRQPEALVVTDRRGNDKVEGNPAPRRALSVTTTATQRQQRQQQGARYADNGNREHRMVSRSGIPRGGRSRSGSLPMVTCWEASAPAKEGSEAPRGADDGEDDNRRPRGRPVRSRNHVDTTSPRAARGTGETSAVSVADGRNVCDRMEAGSAGVAATARNAGTLASRRASSEELRIRQRRRLGGAEGGRAARVSRVSGRDGNDASGGNVSFSTSTPRDGGLNSVSASPPPVEQLPVASSGEEAACFDFEESLSVSSANSAGVVQEQLSVCSSLPPMGGTAATMATDLIFEESSFEDSGASLSQTSSTDRNGADTFGYGGDASGKGGGGCGGGGGSGRGKRGGGGEPGGGGASAPRQRARSSSDEFVRTRSVGRGLSNLMTRIHEQEESEGSPMGSPHEPLLQSLGLRPGAGEIFRIQELSDCDDDGVGSVLSTSRPTASSPTFPATVAPLAATAPVSMNVGHQRAALELRNLTLEREVEQLKTHLRNMGGDDVVTSDRHLHGARRPRPRQQHRVGDRTLLPRPAAPSPLSETPPSISRRASGGVGGGDDGKSCGAPWRSEGRGDGGTSARGKAEGGRARRSWDNHREGGEQGGNAAHHRGRHPPTASVGEAADSTKSSTRGDPCPPREGDGHRVSSTTTTTTAGVAGSGPTAAVAAADSSPARKLRLTRPRSPVSSSSVASLTEASPPPEAAGERREARGTFAREGDAGNAGGATRRSSRHDKDDRAEGPTGDDLSGNVAAKRALPRLRDEEAERRRGARSKSRAARAPINLGGVVSGIKHTLLTRRRSTGDRGAPVPAPTSSQTTPRSVFTRGQGSGGGGDIKDTESRSLMTPTGEDTIAFNAAAVTTASAPDSEQSDKKKRGSRRTVRAGDTSGRSSSEPPSTLTPVAAPATAAATAKKRQRARERSEERSKPGLGARGVQGEETAITAVNAGQEVAGTDGDAIAPLELLDTETSGRTVVEAAVRGPSTQVSALAASGTVKAGMGVVPVTVVAVGKGENNADKSPIYGRWPATLDARWAEVEFMLCHEVNCEESLQYTIQATEAGLVFMEKLEEKARELGVLKGQLSRWLLPFNADTSVEEQQAATPRRFQESLQALSANSGAGLLTEEEAEYLTAGARRVRQLVRVKIADDNDLNTAREALTTMAGFFASISEEAAKRGGSATAFSVLQERRAVSPLTRPPPLPSIPRPSSAMKEPTTQRVKGFHSVTSSIKETDTAHASDSVAREMSLAPTWPTDPASTSEAAGPTRKQGGGPNGEYRRSSGPEAHASVGDHTTGGQEYNGTVSQSLARTPTEVINRADGATLGPTTGTNHPGTVGRPPTEGTATATTVSPGSNEPVNNLVSIPRDDGQDTVGSTAARAAASTTSNKITPPMASSANASERPEKRGGVASGPRPGYAGDATTTARSARDRSSSFKGAVPDKASSVRGGEELGEASSSSLHVPLGHSPRSGTGGDGDAKAVVAPAESLVRLKRRRQPARTRANSQR